MISPLSDAKLLLPDTAKDAVTSVITAIAALRQDDPPRPWKDVEFSVSLSSRAMTKYVWVLAALLHARGLTWDEIAAHPWVSGKLTSNVLRNKHAKRKLPTEQTFSEFAEWYRKELKSRFTEVMAEQARQDAVSLHDLCYEVLLDCKRTQRKLSAGQQGISFKDDVPLSAKQLDLELLRVKVRKDNMSAIDSASKLLRLTTSQPTDIVATPEEAQEAAMPTDPEGMGKWIAQKRSALKTNTSGEAA